jgi:hypothetical protein
LEEEQRLLDTSLTDSEQIQIEKKNPSNQPSLSGRERSILWKDSLFKRNKNNLTIRSDESIYFDDESESDHLIQEEEEENSKTDNQPSSSSPEIHQNATKRFLFGLTKFSVQFSASSIKSDSIQLSNSSATKSCENSKSSSAESKLDQTISTSDSTISF